MILIASQIIDYVNQLASNNSMVSVSTIGVSYESRDIVTVRISSGGGDTKSAIYLECGMHAREWIAHSTCIWIIDEVCSRLRLSHWFFIRYFNYTLLYCRMMECGGILCSSLRCTANLQRLPTWWIVSTGSSRQSPILTATSTLGWLYVFDNSLSKGFSVRFYNAVIQLLIHQASPNRSIFSCNSTTIVFRYLPSLFFKHRIASGVKTGTLKIFASVNKKNSLKKKDKVLTIMQAWIPIEILTPTLGASEVQITLAPKRTVALSHFRKPSRRPWETFCWVFRVVSRLPFRFTIMRKFGFRLTVGRRSVQLITLKWSVKIFHHQKHFPTGKTILTCCFHRKELWP